MQAGKLRHRIELQRDAGTTQDAYGAPAADWRTYATRWAAVAPVSGREAQFARTFAATVSHRVTLRYTPDVEVLPQHRVLWGARVFSIDSVQNADERNRELTLFCTEVVGEPAAE